MTRCGVNVFFFICLSMCQKNSGEVKRFVARPCPMRSAFGDVGRKVAGQLTISIFHNIPCEVCANFVKG
jgi:hypothetical protein